MLYSKDSLNAFRHRRRRGNPPAKFRKRGGAAPTKTAKEPVKNIGSDYILLKKQKKIFTEKEKCEICNKIVNGDSVLILQEIFKQIGYEIPISCIKGETEMVNISGKIKGKHFVRVGIICHYDKKIKIALKRIESLI